MSEQNVVPIHLVDVEMFHWINENCDLRIALDEKLGDHYLAATFLFQNSWQSIQLLSRYFTKKLSTWGCTREKVNGSPNLL